MIKIKRSRLLLGLGILLILGGGIFLANFFSKQFYKSADQKLLNGDYKSALRDYNSAKALWPFLANKKTFQSRVAFVNREKDRPQLIIFLREKTSQSQIDELTQKLQQFKGIVNIVYVSKTDALKRYLETINNDPALKELVTAEILPASIEVYLDPVGERENIEQWAKKESVVEMVIVNKLSIPNLDNLQYYPLDK